MPRPYIHTKKRMKIAGNIPQQGWIVQAGTIIIDGNFHSCFIVYLMIDLVLPAVFSVQYSYRIDDNTNLPIIVGGDSGEYRQWVFHRLLL
jgi:hypothetical protein